MSRATPDLPRTPSATPRDDVTVVRDVVAERRTALRRFRMVAIGEALTDAACIAIALLIVRAFGVGRVSNAEYALAVLVSTALWVGVFHAFGLYRPRRMTAYDEFRRLIAACGVGVVTVLASEFWWNEIFSRKRLVALLALTFVLELIARRLWRWYVRNRKRRGSLALRTLIVGANDEGAQIAAEAGPTVRGFSLLGVVSTRSNDVRKVESVPLLGTMADVDRLVEELGVECLFVASTAVNPDEMRQLSRLSRVRNLELRVAVNLPMVHTPRVAVQTVNDVTALAISPTHITRGQAALKRTFDLAAASIGMLLTSPVLAVLAAAIRLTSPGPVLFRQPRVTKDGRIFTVLKFRTMVTDHRAALEDTVIDLSKPFFKLEDDPRLTSVGRFLRKTSLDELPQLINVIRGDMSLVGPRPLPADQVHANPELLGPRHEVRAGVTGWWQVHGRSDVEPEEAVQMDLFYIENWSLSLDLYLILKTLGAVVARRGAR